MQETGTAVDILERLSRANFENQHITSDLRVINTPKKGWIQRSLGKDGSPVERLNATASAVKTFLHNQSSLLSHYPSTQRALKTLSAKLIHLRSVHAETKSIEGAFTRAELEINNILRKQQALKQLKGWNKVRSVSPTLEEALLECFQYSLGTEDGWNSLQATMDRICSFLATENGGLHADTLASHLKTCRRSGYYEEKLLQITQHLIEAFEHSPGNTDLREFIEDSWLDAQGSHDTARLSHFLNQLHRIGKAGEEKTCNNLADLWKAGEHQLAMHLALSFDKSTPLLSWANSDTSSAIATALRLDPRIATDKQLLLLIEKHTSHPTMPPLIKTLLELKGNGKDALIDTTLDYPPLMRWAEAGHTALLERLDTLEPSLRPHILGVSNPTLAFQLIELIESNVNPDLIEWAATHASGVKDPAAVQVTPVQVTLGEILYLKDHDPDKLEEILAKSRTIDDRAFKVPLPELHRRMDLSMNRHAKLWKTKLTRATRADQKRYQANSFAYAASELLVTRSGQLNVGLIPLIRKHPYFKSLDPRSETKRYLNWMFELLVTDPEVRAAISEIVPPRAQRGAAASVIRKDLRLRPRARITTRHARQAVVLGLLSRLRQGRTGSCFGTGPLIGKLHERQGVLQTLHDLRESIQNGHFARTIRNTSYQFYLAETPWEQGPAERHDNELMRSFEQAHCSLAGPGVRGALASFRSQLFEEGGLVQKVIVNTAGQSNLTDSQREQILVLLPTYIETAADKLLSARYLPNKPRKKVSGGDSFGSWRLERNDPRLRQESDHHSAILATVREGFHDLREAFKGNPKTIHSLEHFEELVIAELRKHPLELDDFDSGGYGGLLLAHDAEQHHPRRSHFFTPQSAENLLYQQLRWVRRLPQREQIRARRNPESRLTVRFTGPQADHIFSLLPSRDPRVAGALAPSISESMLVAFWKRDVEAKWCAVLEPGARRQLLESLPKQSTRKLPKHWLCPRDLAAPLAAVHGKEKAEAILQRALVKAEIIKPLHTMDTNWMQGSYDINAGFLYNPLTGRVTAANWTANGAYLRIKDDWGNGRLSWQFLGSPTRLTPATLSDDLVEKHRS